MILRETAYLLLLLMMISGCKTEYNYADFKAERTVAAERKKFDRKLKEQTILQTVQTPPSAENEEAWQGAFWAMELCSFRNDTSRQAVQTALKNFNARSRQFQRAALECAIALFPNEFAETVNTIAQQTASEKIFTMAVHYLQQADSSLFNKEWCLNLIQNKFSSRRDHPILRMLQFQLRAEHRNRPPLIDLLVHPFPGQMPVIFSLQRRNRDYPGLALIRKGNGRFLREKDGSIFSVRQLARSMSNMPGFLTNGNSPQGVYSVNGTASSDNVFIGPSPVLQSFLPFEVQLSTFLHSAKYKNKSWDLEIYKKILPDSWQNHRPLYEAFFAGKAGRSDIIIHGSTINPEYYKNTPFYPLTPSLGCLTSFEKWSAHDGSCQHSGQIDLVNGFVGSGDGKGFLAVIEIDEKKRPVELPDIKEIILAAESAL